ncbi:MAG: pyruvate formate lyase family protein [Desulfobacterales bacterium]|nr:pyruvate formate lyase family protein [Desulfobacterales bacterium]
MELLKNFFKKKIDFYYTAIESNIKKKPWTNLLANLLLKIMAFNFNYRSSLNSYLKSRDGWINFSIGFSTENKSVAQSLIFYNGKVRVISNILKNIHAQLIFKDDSVVMEMLRLPPNEVINLLLKSKLRTTGNMNYLSLFNFLLSLLLADKYKKLMTMNRKHEEYNLLEDKIKLSEKETHQYHKTVEYLNSSSTDKVVCLDNPFLENYSIQDFPRLKKFLDIHFTQKPEICIERPLILTNWYREHGFEEKNDGSLWIPVVRQGYALKNLLEQKKPIIRENDLLGGTTTTEEIGVILYPDAHAGLLWGELNVLSERALNPYNITKENIEILHFEILPYWLNRNFREWVRQKYNEPICQKLDERFAVYFQWKTVAISHTIPNFPKLLKLGAEGIIAELNIELQNTEDKNSERYHVLNAMILCLEGITAYAKNISIQAFNEAEKEVNPIRKQELIYIGEMCAKVPAKPAQTLDEALQCILIGWITLHMENTNAGLSLGRLDQWLQPYFVSDFKKLKSVIEKEAYIKHSIEMVGCFFMRMTDHLPMIPDIGNYLFGGSSSDQAITLGGCTPEGDNGVNDMTYILLKVTEILKIRDPNVNARYNLNINSEQYLKRLCEVNLITKATPSIHGDKTVLASLKTLDYTQEDANDWSATGCVEPTISGKHFGHTGCIMFNLVAAMEMALNQGKHPLMDCKVGPETPFVEEFNSFEEFWKAYTAQLNFLMDNIVEYNNILGEAHTIIRPSPLLSSLIEGCIEKGKDVTSGGAKYNSTGTACIGLSDIVDSVP